MREVEMRVREISAAAGVLVLGSLLLVPAVPAWAGTSTRVVDDDGRASVGDCRSGKAAPRRIQKAIDASAPGDVILVCPGTYRGGLRITTGGLIIRATQRRKAVVTSHPTVPSVLVHVDAKRVTIRGLTLRARTADCDDQVDAMLSIQPGSYRASVLDTAIVPAGDDTMGACGYADGIRVSGSRDVRIEGNLVRDFTELAIRVEDDATGASVLSNTIRYWHADEDAIAAPTVGEGIAILDGASALVRDNLIVGLPSSMDAGSGGPVYGSTPLIQQGIRVLSPGPGTIVSRNTVRYAWYRGMVVGNAADAAVRANVIRDTAADGLVISGATGGTVAKNVLTNIGRNDPVQYAALSAYTSSGVTFRENDARGGLGLDCTDDSSGSGTGGTANTWVDNLGLDADPAAICASS
jgi:hypothetical protein